MPAGSEVSWTVGERDGVQFAHTLPSPRRYRRKCYGKSCFAAMTRRHFDPDRSRAELETLVAPARPVGHTIS
jgi:hypothetical protein